MTLAADMDEEEREGLGGLATLWHWPTLLGQMLAWWSRHVLPYLWRPWEAPDRRVFDRIPNCTDKIMEHMALSHDECDTPPGRCNVHARRER